MNPSYWINFALYAVAGRLGEADFLMRAKHDDVVKTARRLCSWKPPEPTKLYRGIVLSQDNASNERLEADPKFEFVSFSEDLDVATWFADPESIISQFVRTKTPDPVGRLIETELAPDRLLFHHSWRRIPGFGDLVDLAWLHPELRELAEQIEWSLDTQREAILLPDELGYELQIPSAPRTAELNARFAPPCFRSIQP